MRVEEAEILEETNERVLWAAVMERAVYDLKSKDKLQRGSASEWFQNRRRTDVGSFIWVCEVLDIDPDRYRKLALNRSKKAGTVK